MLTKSGAICALCAFWRPILNCTDCTAFGNFTTGFNAPNSGLIRITNSNVYNHATGIAGNVKSGGGNKFASNSHHAAARQAAA